MIDSNRYRFMYGADGREDVPHRDWLIMFDRVLKEVKEEDDFFGARVSCTTTLIKFGR